MWHYAQLVFGWLCTGLLGIGCFMVGVYVINILNTVSKILDAIYKEKQTSSMFREFLKTAVENKDRQETKDA